MHVHTCRTLTCRIPLNYWLTILTYVAVWMYVYTYLHMQYDAVWCCTYMHLHATTPPPLHPPHPQITETLPCVRPLSSCWITSSSHNLRWRRSALPTSHVATNWFHDAEWRPKLSKACASPSDVEWYWCVFYFITHVHYNWTGYFMNRPWGSLVTCNLFMNYYDMYKYLILQVFVWMDKGSYHKG